MACQATSGGVYAMTHQESEKPADIVVGITTLYGIRVQIFGDSILVEEYCQSCPVRLGDRVFLVNLALMPLKEFDVVLGMDCLTKHHATIDCKQRTMTFSIPGQADFVYVACKSTFFTTTIYASQAKQMMIGGCVAYLVSELRDRVEKAVERDFKDELTRVRKEIVDFHREMVFLENYSTFNYTGT
uniref:Uncharacterized protein n=1 Tax=Ananas comosus var. bracteatus TaxID=296719 RepID=A0A6V7QH65_ANACO|nr:unnamed protein product [Ananas comosus var. bracteatus]